MSDNFSHTYKLIFSASWAIILVFYSILFNLVILYFADILSLASFFALHWFFLMDAIKVYIWKYYFEEGLFKTYSLEIKKKKKPLKSV